jgi:diguanylate cyclase (GGDEF)-like protein
LIRRTPVASTSSLVARVEIRELRSVDKIKALFHVPTDNPELAQSQIRMFTSQVPMLYFMLLVNVSAICYIHWDTAPRFLTADIGTVLIAFCFVRMAAWAARRKRTLSPEQAVRQLRITVRLTSAVSALFFAWGIALYPYGDAYGQGLIAFLLAITAIGCIVCLTQLPAAALLVAIVGILPVITFLFLTGKPTFCAMAIELGLVTLGIVNVVLNHSRDFASLINFQKELAKQHQETLRLAEENSRLANLDALTGLPNRRQFFARLEDTLRVSGPARRRFAVGVLDLDGFKQVNDVYGHAAGDQLLIETGLRLREISPETTLLARLGGDEFGLVVEGELSEAEIRVFGERVCSALRTPFSLVEATVQIAGSIGFAIYPDAGQTAAQLSERADYALYHAKQHLPGRPIIFSREHETEIRRLASIDKVLRAADLDRELSMHFQPIVDIERGAVVAFEALARWDSPELGRVPPGLFIPIAERSDFINRLTQVLLRKALAHARNWPEELRVSFNLSIRDLTAEAVLEIISIVGKSGVTPSRIDLEVTETALMRDFDKGRDGLKALKALGVAIALDDFGTGYSSLSYVHRLPLDKIKIDRSFIKDIETQPASRDIVKAVIDLCGALKLDCVIEGIETREQARILRGLGATMMQGYYFGRDMPAEALSSSLADAARVAEATASAAA